MNLPCRVCWRDCPQEQDAKPGQPGELREEDSAEIEVGDHLQQEGSKLLTSATKVKQQASTNNEQTYHTVQNHTIPYNSKPNCTIPNQTAPYRTKPKQIKLHQTKLNTNQTKPF